MLSRKCNEQGRSAIGHFTIGSVGLFLLVGCSDTALGPDQSASSSTEGSAAIQGGNVGGGNLANNLLDNAIQVGDDLYMLPKGIDEEGCEMFGPYSENSLTVTANQYRQADGSFSVAKDPAVCGVEMVSLGSDEEGCEMYQAKPVNNGLEPTAVVYYQDADGRYVPRKPASSCTS